MIVARQASVAGQVQVRRPGQTLARHPEVGGEVIASAISEREEGSSCRTRSRSDRYVRTDWPNHPERVQPTVNPPASQPIYRSRAQPL